MTEDRKGKRVKRKKYIGERNVGRPIWRLRAGRNEEGIYGNEK